MKQSEAVMYALKGLTGEDFGSTGEDYLPIEIRDEVIETLKSFHAELQETEDDSERAGQ